MTNLVFGTQMMTITLIVIITQVLLLSFIIISILSSPTDKSRQRFLMLTVCFMAYNFIGGVFLDENSSVPIVFQNILIYGTAIIMVLSYFLFLSKEFNFKFNSIFSVKFLIISLSTAFVFGYGITYWITREYILAHYTFISLSSVISVYYCYRSLIEFIKRAKKYRNHKTDKVIFYTSLIGIVFIAILPFESILGEYQALEVITVNISYFLLAYAFIKRHIFKQNKIVIVSSEIIGFNETNNWFDNLTKKELEVANYILEGKLYRDIAESMFIVEKTVSKHASNIYKKTKTKNKYNFIKKYSI